MISDARRKGFDAATGEGKPNPVRLAADWLVGEWRGPGMVRERGAALAAYRDGWWETLPPGVESERVLADGYRGPAAQLLTSRGWAEAVRTALALARPMGRPPAGSHRICLQNGTLDLDTGELGFHSPGDMLIAQLPFAYDPAAECPVYDRVAVETLAQVGEDGVTSEEDTARAIATFEEFVAYTLVESHEYRKFLVLQGKPASGKSTLLHVAQLLHGSGFCSAISVAQLADERYRVKLVAALVNLSSEAAVSSFVADDVLKAVTAGDPIELRYLNHQSLCGAPEVTFVKVGGQSVRVRAINTLDETLRKILHE